MRLRYAGPWPVTFVDLGIEALPGTEFEVPDDAAAAFLARADVEEVPASSRRKAAKPAAPAEAAGVTPAPVTEEVPSGVPDDH